MVEQALIPGSENEKGKIMKKKIILSLILLISFLARLEAFEFKRMIGPIFSSYSRPWPNPFYEAFPLSPDQTSTLSPLKNSRISFFGGVGLEFPLSRSLTFEIDGLYKETGGHYQVETFVFDSYRYQFELKEISFPFLLRIYPWRKTRAYLLTGGDLVFILSHYCHLYHRPEAGTVFEKTAEADISDLTRKTDLALVLGTGFEVPFDKRKIGVELRYEIGLPDLYVEPWPASVGTNIRVHSRQLLLVITYSVR